MSSCIYLFMDRIIYWHPQTLFARPVSLPDLKWYVISAPPPRPLNEMIEAQNCSFTLQKGFMELEGPLPLGWEKHKDMVRQIQIMNSLNALANVHKLKYTDNALGQPLADIVLMDEIREYRKTGSLENCPILVSLLETTEAGLTPDALATKLWLRYETYGTIVAYLNRVEFAVRAMLAEGKNDEAAAYINSEFEKMKT